MDYKEILELILDENDFTVGGGCSAALAGAMACGLIGMAINLSMGKELGLSDEELAASRARLSELKTRLLAGSIKDRAAYLKIRDAYKLPKDTDAQKAARQAAIAEAGYIAASIPKENALLNKEVYLISKVLSGKTNTNANTDFLIGQDLAKLGIDAAKQNIEVNLGLIKDEEKLKELNQTIHELAELAVPEGR